MAAYWTNNIRTYWLKGQQTCPGCASWVSCSGNPCIANLPFTRSSVYWCKGVFFNGAIVDEPNNNGCGLVAPSPVCEYLTAIVGNLGNCLNDFFHTVNNLYICEYGG
jgi:hypothetical protein